MIIFSDLHIGVNRSAGTTPQTALQLRQYLLSSFEKALESVKTDVIILGDLFDTYQIPMSDLLETYRIFCRWLERGHKLTLVCGNHDLSTDSSKLSSFQFLGALFDNHQQVEFVQGGGKFVSDGVYVIPHMPNQDLFDLELSKVPETKFLLVHCNYDNYFAKESDHSLNLSKEQAQNCKAEKIVFAHEHHARTALAGKVVIPGNQFPSSVSDCLDDNDKFMTELCDNGEVKFIQTWSKSGFAEIDWKQLESSDAQFIRVVGSATPEEAADMADAIAKYRKRSEALVITNAVKVGSDDIGEELTLNSLEAISKFDVMAALKKMLTEDEIKTLESLK